MFGQSTQSEASSGLGFSALCQGGSMLGQSCSNPGTHLYSPKCSNCGPAKTLTTCRDHGSEISRHALQCSNCQDPKPTMRLGAPVMIG